MNNQEKIFQHISQYVSLNSEEEAIFRSLLKHKIIKKKEYLLRSGKINRHESFVLSGCFRTFYTDNEGKEHTTIFSTENWWVSERMSFYSGLPSKLSIQALEISEVLQITRKNLEEIYIRIPKFERLFRILFQNAYLSQQERIINKMSLTAEERYSIFLSKYPELQDRLSLKVIASYLGITPEFLSMIRANRH